jgi:hypothetical protein
MNHMLPSSSLRVGLTLVGTKKRKSCFVSGRKVTLPTSGAGGCFSGILSWPFSAVIFYCAWAHNVFSSIAQPPLGCKLGICPQYTAHLLLYKPYMLC